MRLIFWSVIWIAIQAELGASEKDLYILGLYPETGGWSLPLGPLTSTMALDHINSREDLLPGYKLNVEWRNSDCSDKVALESFINSLTSNRTYLGVFGPGCSVAAVSIANISPAYGLITFSYAAASPSLEDEVRYKYFIRGLASDTSIAVGRINFIENYGWRRVAIISQQEELFVYNSYVMEEVLTDLGIDYRTGSFDTKSLNVDVQIKNAINLILETGYRIIIANMYEDAAIRFICQVKLTINPLPYLTWLMIGWYTSDWDRDAYSITNGKCTSQDIRDVINGAVGIVPYQLYNTILQSNETTISGFTPQELYNAYRQIALDNNIDFETEHDSVDAYVYDSLWTYALGINQTIAEGYNPDEFSYTNLEFTQSLYVNTFSQKFMGWTGEVSYFGRERKADTVQVVEFVEGNNEYRGYYANLPANSSEYGNTTGVTSDILPFKFWNAARASDGIQDRFSSIIIFAVVLVISTLLCIYITVLIVVIIIGVKMNLPPATKSEPLINIAMLAGNYITVMVAVVLSVDGKFFSTLRDDSPECIAYCHTQVLLPTISSSIVYGGVLAKASKYYIIVVKNKFKYIDWLQAKYLLLFPLTLVIFDIILVISWGVISPILYESTVIPSGETDPPLIRIYSCVVLDNAGFAVPFAVVNILMIVAALFLAYHLRKVVNKSQRYSSTIVWTVYTSVIFTIIIILLLVFVVDPSIRIGLSALITEISAFTVSSIIGLPVVYYLVKDPKGVTFFKSQAQDEYPEDTELLKLRIAALERDLDVYKKKESENTSGFMRVVNRIRKTTREFDNKSYDINNPDSPVKMNQSGDVNFKRNMTFAN